MKNKYDMVLIEKEGITGLTKEDTIYLFDMLNHDSAYPIEIFNTGGESSAMGFITNKAAEKIEYDYETSGLNNFVSNILADMNLESPTKEYTFKDIHIYLTR